MNLFSLDTAPDFFELDSKELLIIEDLAISGEVCDTFRQNPHAHAFYTLFFIKGGAGKLICDFNEYEIKPGRIFFIGPGQIHFLQNSIGLQGSVVQFSSDFMTCLISDSFFRRDFRFLTSLDNLPYIEPPEELFKEIGDLIEIMKCTQNSAVKFKIQQAASLLCVILFKTADFLIPKYPSRGGRQKELFQILLHSIDDNFREHKLVEFYENILGISYQRLNRLCSQLAGKPFKQILHERILLEARRMLSLSSLHISQISSELGYDEPAYFARIFRKYFHFSPTDFKVSLRQR